MPNGYPILDVCFKFPVFDKGRDRQLSVQVGLGDLNDDSPFAGPVEIDETYMGGRECNKYKGKKLKAGRGTVGKTAVVGAKDRKTNKVRAKVTKKTDAKTLQKFVADSAAEGATVCLHRINNQVSQSLRCFWYQPVPNHLTTDSLRLRPFSYNVIK